MNKLDFSWKGEFRKDYNDVQNKNSHQNKATRQSCSKYSHSTPKETAIYKEKHPAVLYSYSTLVIQIFAKLTIFKKKSAESCK